MLDVGSFSFVNASSFKESFKDVISKRVPLDCWRTGEGFSSSRGDSEFSDISSRDDSSEVYSSGEPRKAVSANNDFSGDRMPSSLFTSF